MKQRRLQGGSLASYIIVGVLLGVVLIGGLYGLQRYNLRDGIQIAGSGKEEDRDKTTKKDESTSKDEKSTKDEQQPASDESEKDQAPAAGDTSTDELPATGPEHGLLTSLTFAGLTYVAVAAARSRHWTSRGN